MATLYILTTLLLPFLLAIYQFIFGADYDKEDEILKANISKIVFLTQIFFSGYALFFIPEQTLDIPIIHLDHYHYTISFALEKRFYLLTILFSLLFLITEKLSFNYLHAEEEHSRFYSLQMILNFSVIAFIFGQNIDFLYFCWEIVGISSALLISYFYKRNQAIENSIFAFSIYRICDIAFLLCGVLLFYFYHVEDIGHSVTGTPALILGILLFITIMGKSGVYPMSSWLPQALEGPTSSSNLYYMTLSTHLGPILLIKSYSIWESSEVVKWLIIFIASMNIIITSISARTQTTIKGALGYSVLSQVSVILIEIALGFLNFALIHIALHVFHRLIQMALAPSIIDEHNIIEKICDTERIHSKKGKIYFLGVHGFNSEKIILGLLKKLYYPFSLLEKLEKRLTEPKDLSPHGEINEQDS